MIHPLLLAIPLVGLIAAHATQTPEAARGDAPVAPAVSLKPLVSWSGSFSSITDNLVVRITDAAEWAALWKRHAGPAVEKDSYGEPVVPDIDFSSHMVLAVFDGSTTNTRRETIESIDEFDDHLRIRCMRWTYQTASPPREIRLKPGESAEDVIKRALEERQPRDAGQKTTPYGIFVIPRSGKAIVLEEPVPRKSMPIEWRERTRLGAAG
jgi:hypothetical protein